MRLLFAMLIWRRVFFLALSHDPMAPWPHRIEFAGHMARLAAREFGAHFGEPAPPNPARLGALGAQGHRQR